MYKRLIILLVLILFFGCFSSAKKGITKEKSTADLVQQDNSDSKKQTKLISGFESDLDWLADKGDGTSININTVDGKFKKALNIDYDLKDSKQWVAVHLNIYDFNITKKDVLKLWIKGSGAVNNIEIKIVDTDNSSFIRTFSGATKNNDWIQLNIPVETLQYGWGGDNKLDKINEIWVCITTKQGKNGTLALDNLECIPD